MNVINPNNDSNSEVLYVQQTDCLLISHSLLYDDNNTKISYVEEKAVDIKQLARQKLARAEGLYDRAYKYSET